MVGPMPGVFPKKGWRKVNGEWVDPAAAPPLPTQERSTETAADRRNWANKMAGWPSKEK